MSAGVTVTELFKAAGLQLCGPVPWGEPIAEDRPGVYVVSIVSSPDKICGRIDVGYLPGIELARWVQWQPVIYVGQTARPLSCRLAEFYRHRYGKTAPHRGGQAVKLLQCKQWVFWAASEHSAAKERAMIDAFLKRTGRLPYANRRR